MKKSSINSQHYHGFWIRLLASFIDGALVYLILSWIYVAFMYTDISLFKILLLSFTLYFILSALYEIIFTSIFGATIGKMLFGMKVIDESNNNISIARSTGRYFAKFLSMMIIGIGYLMVAWDDKKQGLHDKLAKTFVVKNENSKIKPFLHKLIFILTIVLLAGYLIYNLFTVASAAIDSFKAGINPINTGNYREEMISRCENRWYAAKDNCYLMYLSLDKNDLLNFTERDAVCKQMATKRYIAECVSNNAIKQNNRSACDLISGWRRLECYKKYDFIGLVKTFLNPAIESKGNLSVEKLDISIESYDECVPVDNSTFTAEDAVCINIINASGFKVGPGNLHWYRLDVRVWDQNNRLISISQDLFKDDHKLFLINDTIYKEGFVNHLKNYAPGNYSIQVDLYDRISQKSWSKNVSIAVVPLSAKLPETMLGIQEVVVGKNSDTCIQGGKNYVPGDMICFMPINVTGFEIGKDGVNWIDVDIKTWNASNKVVSYTKRVFGEEGHILLQNNIWNEKKYSAYNQWVNLNTTGFSAGKYIYEMTIYDRVSGRYIIKNSTFELVNASQHSDILPGSSELSIDSMVVGTVAGDICADLGEGSISSYPLIMVCLEPVVSGLTIGSDGYSQFDMKATLMDNNLTVIFDMPSQYKENGRQILSGGILKGYYSSIPIYNQPPGIYQLKLTVYDRLSGRDATTWGVVRVR